MNKLPLRILLKQILLQTFYRQTEYKFASNFFGSHGPGNDLKLYAKGCGGSSAFFTAQEPYESLSQSPPPFGLQTTINIFHAKGVVERARREHAPLHFTGGLKLYASTYGHSLT